MPRKKGSPKTGGRKRGTPNRVTREFRETVRLLLEENAENVGRWLRLVAEGNGRKSKPDPARALDLLTKLAEYASPKLSRAELNHGDMNETILEAFKLLHKTQTNRHSSGDMRHDQSNRT